MTDKLEILRSRILVPDQLSPWLSYWRFKERRIVFTNGCFDIIHRGHVEYLAQAANLGDILIIGLNSDLSVSKLKGATRPILDEITRANILAAMHFVSAVTIFDEDTPYELIKMIRPNVLVKGGDYRVKEIVGADIVKSYGGKIETIDYVNGCSTSEILYKIKNL